MAKNPLVHAQGVRSSVQRQTHTYETNPDSSLNRRHQIESTQSPFIKKARELPQIRFCVFRFLLPSRLYCRSRIYTESAFTRLAAKTWIRVTDFTSFTLVSPPVGNFTLPRRNITFSHTAYHLRLQKASTSITALNPKSCY